ncbi:MAG: acyltransferase family protein [Massilia sp.]
MKLNEFDPAAALAERNVRLLELDGMRALAVVAVILFHCEVPGLFNAGYFGVDMFFTISGFIISAMLIREYHLAGDFRFGAFYFRRLKRLLPPVLALLALASPIYLLSEPMFLAYRADVPAALAYASNLWQVIERQPYFDATPHVLKHLWSLAVEEQFYLVWPPLAYLALKKATPKSMGVVAALLALLSTGWMWYLYEPHLDNAEISRLYLGTDTHAMGLFAGAALAGFSNPWQVRVAGSRLLRLRRLGAVLSLAGLICMMVLLDPANPWMYRGCFLAVAVLTAVLIHCTMHDSDFVLARLLRSSPVQWLGSRSYSLYLVHWLVFVMIKDVTAESDVKLAYLAAGMVVTGLLAEMMYRCVEEPFKAFKPKRLDNRRMAWCVMAYFLATGLLFAMVMLQREARNDSKDDAAAAVIEAPAPEVVVAAAPVAAATAEPDSDTANEAIEGGDDIFAMGDSVLLGAQATLAKAIPGIHIDAHVGRQASQGLKVITDWRARSGKASTVLVHLGTNGYINEGQFREILGALADRTSVIVINVHAERRWTASNNALIASVCPDFANVRVIDWNGVSTGHPEYFVKDGIHLTGKGIRALVAQIKAITGGAVIPPGSLDKHARRRAAASPATSATSASAASSSASVEAAAPVKAPAAEETPADKPGEKTVKPAAPEHHEEAPAAPPGVADD